jgi:hypothetical protein
MRPLTPILIRIDPDFRQNGARPPSRPRPAALPVHVSDRLLEIHDGPFLELGLKGIAGTLIDRPRRTEDRHKTIVGKIQI